MFEEPLALRYLRKWLTRHALLARVGRLQHCQYGHFSCSTHEGGPCFEEVVDRFYAMARDRALEMVACGADRTSVEQTITRRFPVLGPVTIGMIVDEAFSRGFPTPEP